MINRVITDRDVLAGGLSSPIVLDEHTLLTPAARDRAVQKGLMIVERGAAMPPDSRSASASVRESSLTSPTSGSCGDCGNANCAHCGRHSQGAAGGTPQLSPLLGSLPDGLHLVRVERGQVVSSLPAAGAGMMQPARGGMSP
jgi:hypothetical protein